MHRFAWLFLGCSGLALFALLRAAYLISDNPRLLPGLVVVAALIVPVAFTGYLIGRPGPAPLTVGALAGIAIGGGSAALAVAGLWEYESLIRHSALSMITVATAEEIAKLVPAVVAAWWYARHTTHAPEVIRIGLFSGLAVGAGFAVLETLGYAYAAVVDDGASLRTVDELLAVRGLFSPATHLTWSALNAAAATLLLLAVRASRAGRASRNTRTSGESGPSIVAALSILLGTLVATVALHTVWDTYPTWLAHLVLTAIGLTALGLLDRRLRGCARRPPLALTLPGELREP